MADEKSQNLNNKLDSDIDDDAETLRQYDYISRLSALIYNEKQSVGRPLNACVRTFGCQMNFHDSEKLEGILDKIGYEESDEEHADLIVYNTCTVRENANKKIYGRLGYLSTLKKKNPLLKIVLCGCMMQEKTVTEKIRKSYPFVDLIFGTHNLYKFPELLYMSLTENKRIEEILPEDTKTVESLPKRRKYPFKSGVNIMYGCDNFCSYCIVPYVRGRERSREPEHILNEIENLAGDGVIEVMLLGQNVNSYGKDLVRPVTFSDLLKEVEQIDGIKRIRFMTSHPKDLSDSMIEVMAGSGKICRHLHLPVQSGSSRILKLMNRKYTKERYISLVEKLRSAVPDIALTTDIIVGFPGESEEDFEETLDLVRTVRFDNAFTFIYSKRTGTPAASMDNQVPEDAVKDRFDRLLKEIGKISAEKNSARTGGTAQVLVEEENSHDPSMVTGRTDSNLLVHFKGGSELIGSLVDVRLVESKGFYYIGELAR